jgi:UPF0755 protein
LKKPLILSVAVAGAFVCAALWATVDLSVYAERPASNSPDKKIVNVGKGQSFYRTAELLAAEGLIQSPVRFRWLARLKSADTRIQAGEYLLSADMPPNRILDIMISGKVRLYRITVPEGANLEQIADIVSGAGLVERNEFLSLCRNPDAVRAAGIDADTFEGYLFPDTYLFPRSATAKDVVATMTAHFRSVFTEAWKARAAEMGFTVHEIVTLASIIEKETGAPQERPLIASVFHNRLRRGMRLETDPTVIYGLENFDGNLTRRDLRTPTPYNTYKIKGLPPGPIASPGAAALEAALYPADTGYLFFVSKKDSTHKFSTNLSDHNRAIRRYQLNRKSRRR